MFDEGAQIGLRQGRRVPGPRRTVWYAASHGTEPDAVSGQFQRPPSLGGGTPSLFESILKPNTHDRADAWLFHRHPINPIRGLDGARIVGNHDELRILFELVQ